MNKLKSLFRRLFCGHEKLKLDPTNEFRSIKRKHCQKCYKYFALPVLPKYRNIKNNNIVEVRVITNYWDMLFEGKIYAPDSYELRNDKGEFLDFLAEDEFEELYEKI